MPFYARRSPPYGEDEIAPLDQFSYQLTITASRVYRYDPII